MRIGLAFTFLLPYPDNLPFSIRRSLSAIDSGEQIFPVNNSPSLDTTEKPVGKGKCECKAFPRKVCPDRNRVWLRANKMLNLSRHLLMLFLSDETFQVIPSHRNPQMRRTLFDDYLFKYRSVKYQTFHQVSEKTFSKHTRTKSHLKAFQMPPSAININ